MGLRERLAGTEQRDRITAAALADAQKAAANGLPEVTVTVHSTHGGSALLPRLVPHVVSEMQRNGFAVVNVTQDDWAYNANPNRPACVAAG